MSPDGLLTTEFALIEHYARLGAEGRHNDDYWCDALARPELQCLDIGAPSTLGGSLNVSRVSDGGLLSNNMLIYEIQETANASSVDLFGQYDLCHGGLIGDGVIDVFDMATLLSYIFGDWRYGDLSPDPHTVLTTQGRRAAASLCGQGLTRQDYANQYAVDTCVHTDGGGGFETGGRRLAELHSRTTPPPSRNVVGVYIRSCGTYERCVIVDRPVYMIFISILDSPHGANVTGVDDATVHRHASGVVLSRGAYGGGTLAPIDGDTRRILVPPDARLGRVQAYASEKEELSVLARPSFPVRWSHYVASPSTSASLSPRNGYWTTFDMSAPVSRLHAVFAQRFDAHLSMQQFTASDKPGWNEVRITRHCAPERCNFCASIETGLNAVHHGTLEMFQTPIHSSCAYSLHVYASERVTLQYAIATTSRDFHHPAWSSISCLKQRSSDASPSLLRLPPPQPATPPPPQPAKPPPPQTTTPPLTDRLRETIWISLGLFMWSAVLCVFVARIRTRRHRPRTR